MEKFKNTYRIPSARAPWWDYSWQGCYFITICTAHQECIFGEIRNGQMKPSPIGEIVLREWEQSFQIRAELFCDAFVLMPNHLHAIVRIQTPKQTPPPPTNTGIAHRSPRSISSFVAGFKSSATKRINEFRNTPKMPVWQSRFNDHIIRNDDEYHRIANYIRTNPEKWENDKFFKQEIP